MSVLVSSGSSNLLNFYCFSENLDTTGQPIASQGSITIHKDLKDAGNVSLQNVLFLPVPLLQRSSKGIVGHELQYIELNVRFYQLWALKPDLGMWSTLCCVHSSGSATGSSHMLNITSPTTKLFPSSGHLGSRRVKDDPFIVPDELDDDDFPAHTTSLPFESGERSPKQVRDDLRFRMNWTGMFQRAFVKGSQNGGNDSLKAKSPRTSPILADLLQRVADRIDLAKAENSLGMATL